MEITTGSFCPLVGGDCLQLKCKWFTQLRGKHPQTGKDIDEWDCAMVWMPILLIEGAKESRHTAAAIESFRNKMIEGQQEVLEMTKNGEITHQR